MKLHESHAETLAHISKILGFVQSKDFKGHDAVAISG